MSKKKISARTFSPKKEDIIIFDTNVIIYLFHPIDYNNTHQEYNDLYEKILQSKARLIISSIQVSEFINKCIRLQFDLYKKDQENTKMEFKKDYRSTEDYKNSMDAILGIMEQDIMKHFQFADDNFSAMQKEKLFLYACSYDFNDAFLVEFAKIHNAILVTNDIDFVNYKSNITIVTANQLLLKFH